MILLWQRVFPLMTVEEFVDVYRIVDCESGLLKLILEVIELVY